MARRIRVEMLLLHENSPRDREAHARLAAVLPDAEVGAADETGAFEIEVEADDLEQALTRVRDAIAASGTDDHIAFLEHPDLPEHWRARSRAAGS
jgi:hypothetical protein